MKKLKEIGYFLAFALLFSGTMFQMVSCQKAKPNPKPENPSRTYMRESQSVSEAEHDAALITLSKGFIDLLQDENFVQNELFGLVGPCGEGWIDEASMNRVIHIGNGETSTIHAEMNKAIEKYTEGLTTGEDHVDELLGKFKVNDIQYMPSLYIPNVTHAKISTTLPLAAPGVNYGEVEGKNGDVVHAWKSNGTTLAVENIDHSEANSGHPIVIFTTMSMDYYIMNDPCGGSYPGPNPGNDPGTSSDGSETTEESEQRGPGILGNGTSIINLKKLRLVNKYEQGNWTNPKAEIHYQLTVFADPLDPNSLTKEDYCPKPSGVCLGHVSCNDIDNRVAFY